MMTLAQLSQPTNKQLKQFAIVLPLAIGALGWMLGLDRLPISIGVICGALLALVTQRKPAVAKPLFIVMAMIALPFGLILREVVLLCVYFGIVTPIGLFFRVTGRDALHRNIDRQVVSYWRKKANSQSQTDYLRRW